MQDLALAHWIYLIGVAVILATMLTRKNIVVPAVLFTFLTAAVFSGSLVTGLASIFNGSLVAAKELFNIFLIIAFVTGMLGALQALGADTKMVAPFRRVMRNGHMAFWALACVTYVISLFFWPTPAVPLIGAVLIPVAIRAGLRPLAVGFTIAVAGQGMALSSDFVIRVAPGLSAAAAGADPDQVANRAMVLSLIVGGIALALGYAMEVRKMRKPSQALLEEWERTDVLPTDGDAGLRGTPVDPVDERVDGLDAPGGGAAAPTPARVPVGAPTGLRGETSAASYDSAALAGEVVGAHDLEYHEDGAATQNAAGSPTPVKPWITTAFAVAVPLAYLALIVYLVSTLITGGSEDGLKGGDAAALVGGIAAIVILLGSFAEDRGAFLERSAEHIVDGLVFAFKAMGIVLPIAGFFFIGNGAFAGDILGIPPNADGTSAAPSLMTDLVLHGQAVLPESPFITAFAVLLVGMVAGLEGSGFSGLPLTGSLAGSLGPATGIEPATLAAIGQMGNIWSGGGTLVAWSSLIAVAGFARVSVIELARMCFVPVVTGLVVSTIAAVLLFG